MGRAGKGFMRVLAKMGPFFTLVGAGVCFGMAGAHRSDEKDGEAQKERNEMYGACAIQLLIDVAIDVALGWLLGCNGCGWSCSCNFNCFYDYCSYC